MYITDSILHVLTLPLRVHTAFFQHVAAVEESTALELEEERRQSMFYRFSRGQESANFRFVIPS